MSAVRMGSMDIGVDALRAIVSMMVGLVVA